MEGVEWPTPHLVLISGYARSGTTVIGNILGELPGVAHIGELDGYWQRTWDLEDRRLCGCSETLSACGVWSAVRARAELGPTSVEALAGAERELLSPVKYLAAPTPSSRASLHELGEATSRIRQAWAETVQANVLVDSSKRPGYVRLAIDHHPGRVSLLHVVRDVRGVVASRRRDAARKGVNHLRLRAVKDALSWMQNYRQVRNLEADYTLLRYEDFAKDPAGSLSDVIRSLCVNGDVGAVFDDRTARVGTHHTFWGNRTRWETGRIPIRADERWREELDAVDQILVTIVGWPLLRLVC